MSDKVLDWIMLPDPAHKNRMFFVNRDWMIAWSGEAWEAFRREADQMTKPLHNTSTAQACMDWVAAQIQEAGDA